MYPNQSKETGIDDVPVGKIATEINEMGALIQEFSLYLGTLEDKLYAVLEPSTPTNAVDTMAGNPQPPKPPLAHELYDYKSLMNNKVKTLKDIIFRINI